MTLNQTAKAAIDAEPAFVLLFSIHLESAFKGYGALRRGIATMSSKQTGNYLAWLAEFETRLLVKMFREAGCRARDVWARCARRDNRGEFLSTVAQLVYFGWKIG
jgi:hypothetical protein